MVQLYSSNSYPTSLLYFLHRPLWDQRAPKRNELFPLVSSHSSNSKCNETSCTWFQQLSCHNAWRQSLAVWVNRSTWICLVIVTILSFFTYGIRSGLIFTIVTLLLFSVISYFGQRVTEKYANEINKVILFLSSRDICWWNAISCSSDLPRFTRLIMA